MNRFTKVTPYLIAAGAGLAWYLVARAFWGIYAAQGLLNRWLLENVLPQSHTAYYTLIYVHDLIVNIALAYLFALPFLKVPRASRWTSVAVVVVGLFLYEYRLVLSNPSTLKYFLTNAGTLIGMLAVLGLLPLTIWLASTQRELGTYNNRMERTRDE